MRLLLLLIAGIIIYRFAKAWLKKQHADRPRATGSARGQIDDVMVQDPQCGVYFPRRDGVPLSYRGQDLLFCSEKCKQAFLARSDHA